MATLAVLVLLLLFCSLTQESVSVPALYVFGDSNVDPGNNNNITNGVRANFFPYGVDFDNTSTGRFTNGKTTADFMACLLNLPLPPPYKSLSDGDRRSTMKGINYASGGCGILPQSKPNMFECFSLDQQIDFFNATVQDDLPHVIVDPQIRTLYVATSMFFISIGTNDFILSFPSSTEKDPVEFASFLLLQLEMGLERLYQIGARRFIVNNIGPLGCLPIMVNKTTSQCDQQMNLNIMPYNNQLIAALKNWQDEYLGASFALADSHALLTQMLLNPGEYGFKDVKFPCCGAYVDGVLKCLPHFIPCSNRDEYLFFDTGHTSQAANLVFAHELCNNGTICNKLF